MSTQLTREELLDRLDTMEDAIDNLQADNERQAKQIAEQNQRISELEEKNDRLEQSVTQLDGLEGRVNKQRAKLTRRVSNLEDELDLDDQDVIALAEGGEDALRESDLARLLQAGPEALQQNPTAKYYRAETLVRNWLRWGEYRSYDDYEERTLATKRDDLKTRLEDARGESLAWRQIYRAMQLVADLAPDNIRFTDDATYGKKLVQRIEDGGEH